jgi:hypothetical protein
MVFDPDSFDPNDWLDEDEDGILEADAAARSAFASALSAALSFGSIWTTLYGVVGRVSER